MRSRVFSLENMIVFQDHVVQPTLDGMHGDGHAAVAIVPKAAYAS